MTSHMPRYLSRWSNALDRGGTSEVNLSKDAFQVKLDVHQFSPEEIQVKAVDNHVVVEGKHEEVMSSFKGNIYSY